VAPEPIVDLESALEEAAVVETVSIDQPDQTVSLDFDTVMEFEAPASGHQSPDLSLQSPVVSPQSPVVSSQSPVASPQSEDVAAAVPAAVESASAPAYSSSRKTVMIVDDSPTIRKILGLTLERAGYKVIAEPDGESAIERLLQVVPDLILLDIAMPKIDGYDVCKRIKQDPRTKAVPVVMLSGKGALFDKVKGHMAGASEYLTKPFETPAVLAVVATYCEKTAEVVNG
jgi:CheY-like chemotaxis protein